MRCRKVHNRIRKVVWQHEFSLLINVCGHHYHHHLVVDVDVVMENSCKYIGSLPSSIHVLVSHSLTHSLFLSLIHTLNETKPKVKYANGKQRDRAIMAMTASAQKRENKKLNKNASVEKNAGTVNRGGGGWWRWWETNTLPKSYSLRLM